MRALLLLALLAACGREVAAPAPVSFRQAGTPIGSTTRGTSADLLGEWVVSEAFPGAPPGAPPGALLARPGSRVSLAAGPGGQVEWVIDGTTLLATPDGPGRYRAGDLRLWVIWVDDDFRTAAVGTPDGSFGWIMDRPGRSSPDRTLSARAILQFNGYDVGRLVAL